ncbi:hypothetical protein TNCV_54961 [Trichonephila clavipes]|nr:hypothetical protein TNCV_54961 [Trichonephila clavipes]
MVGGKYVMKRLKQTPCSNCWQGSGWRRGIMVWGMFSLIFYVCSSLWKARWINISTHLSFQTMSTPLCALFFPHIYQQDMSTTESVRYVYRSSRVGNPLLIWNPLDRVVRVMDPRSYLVQQ